MPFTPTEAVMTTLLRVFARTLWPFVFVASWVGWQYGHAVACWPIHSPRVRFARARGDARATKALLVLFGHTIWPVIFVASWCAWQYGHAVRMWAVHSPRAQRAESAAEWKRIVVERNAAARREQMDGLLKESVRLTQELLKG